MKLENLDPYTVEEFLNWDCLEDYDLQEGLEVFLSEECLKCSFCKTPYHVNPLLDTFDLCPICFEDSEQDLGTLYSQDLP